MYTLLKYCYKVVKSLNLILILIKEVFRSFRGSLIKFSEFRKLEWSVYFISMHPMCPKNSIFVMLYSSVAF